MVGLLLPSVPWADGDSLPDAPPLQLDPSRLAWSSLKLKGGKLLISVDAEVRLSTVAGEVLARDLITPPRGHPMGAEDDQVLLIEYRSRSMGKDLRTRLWFRARDGAALQHSRLELTPGEERYKLYRYTREGIYRVRRTPLKGEARRPPETWGRIKKSFFPYPPGVPDGMVVSDPAALLYMASVMDLSAPGDEMRMLAYFDDELQLVTMRYEGNEQLAADFRVSGPGGMMRIRGPRRGRWLALDSHPLVDHDGDAALQIIGLGGRPRILMDQRLGAPLELRGRVRVAGEVTLRLIRLRLAPQK